MERRDRLSRVAEVAIWPEGRESRAKEAKGERLPKKYIKIPSQLTMFTRFTLFTLFALLTSAYNAYNALWNKSDGSYVIKDFGTLPTIFSTSQYFRWQFQPCPSFFVYANIQDK